MKISTQNKIVAIAAIGTASALFLSFNTQYTDMTSKDHEQLEIVVRDVVKSEFDKQKAEIQKMIRNEVRGMVAVIDVGDILPKMTEFNDQKLVYQKKFAADQQELQAMGNSIMQKEKELVEMANAMSKPAKEKKEAEIASLRVTGEMKARNLQEHYTKVESDLQMQLMREIQVAADELLKKENRMIILAGGIAAADPTINYSSKVLEQTNKKYEQKKKKESATGGPAVAKPVTMASETNTPKAKTA